MSVELDTVVTFLHDSMCGCGERCHGWVEDRRALVEFSETRWGRASAIPDALHDLANPQT